MIPRRAFARNARFVLLLASSVAVSFAACGVDVDLGGSTDGGLPEAGPAVLVELCEPCTTSASCPALAACANVSGNHAFCATLCPQGTECQAGDSCQLVASAVPSESVRVCAPKLGCKGPKSPTNDGAPLDRCGSLFGPTVSALCTSCDKGDRDCQKNGCYGGWWCNTVAKRCQKPPTTCP